MGCPLTATMDGTAVVKVSGHNCGRGIAYARMEAVAPVRIVTALTRPANRDRPLSVRTAAAIPKNLLFQCVDEIRRAAPAAPIACGDIVLDDVCGTGVAVVATQDME